MVKNYVSPIAEREEARSVGRIIRWRCRCRSRGLRRRRSTGIIDLLGAYAHTYDDNRLDAFRGLSTESPEMVLVHEGRTLTQDYRYRDEFISGKKIRFQGGE